VDEGSLVGRNLDDRYRLLEVIGDGGMGQVFRAAQLATGRTVALKLLHSQLTVVPEIVQRFEREAKVTTHLSHPHIVKTVEFGQWQGRLYLAMEFVAGQSLAAFLDANPGENGRRMTIKRTIAIMRPVLEALEYAHGLGVVHRDLKPDNIMVVPGRGIFAREAVKLLDFGIAKLGEDGPVQGKKLTQAGMLLGTPGYMSPEQAAGQKADVRSDLYSCGVILYEMLAGRRPFEAETSMEILAMHVSATPRPLREITGDASIPAAVEALIMRALAKRPADRFQSARELREGLDKAAKGRNQHAVISGIETTVFATPVAPRARSRWLQVAIILVGMALLVVGHLAPGGLASLRRIISVATGDAASPDEPKRDGERSTVGGAPHAPSTKKPGPKKARTASKRNGSGT
jgi:serine/threonine protein kinase